MPESEFLQKIIKYEISLMNAVKALSSLDFLKIAISFTVLKEQIRIIKNSGGEGRNPVPLI